MSSGTPFQVISHTRRVCSIYKKCLRTIQDWVPDRAEYRYHCAFVRNEFEKNRNVKDIVQAIKLVEFAEKEQNQQRHYQPMKFAQSPGGVDYGRHNIPPDWVLDFWDPIEKMQYPEYFKLREQRKREYLAQWEKLNGKPDPNAHAAH